MLEEIKTLDIAKLSLQVQDMYTKVAHQPQEKYHFEMGRELAIRLGYPERMLNQLPEPSIESFAGVGYYFDLAEIRPGQRVIDFGSGSGMDAFMAAHYTGPLGVVTGVDMTQAQFEKSTVLAKQYDYDHVRFIKGRIEALQIPDASYDQVISNGVINLSPMKSQVFKEAARVLVKGGSFTISDIVTEKDMPESITCNSDLWAACIGGAMQIDEFSNLIEEAGLGIDKVVENREYAFISKSAMGATKQYGVKSISIHAIKK